MNETLQIVCKRFMSAALYLSLNLAQLSITCAHYEWNLSAC